MAAVSRLHHDVGKQSVLTQEDIIRNTLLYNFYQGNAGLGSNRFSHDHGFDMDDGGLLTLSLRDGK